MRRSWRAGPAIVWLMFSAAAAAGCGGDPVESAATASVRLSIDGGGRAPAYGEAPMPTDALRATAGPVGAIAAQGPLEPLLGLEAVAPVNTEMLSRHLAALDGAGLRPTVEFLLDGALDPASVPALTSAPGDAAVVIDVDPASPARWQVVPMEWRYDAARSALAGSPEPGIVLREGNAYAAVLTTALRGAGGAPITGSAGLATIARGTAPARWRSTSEVFAALSAHEGAAFGASIAGLTVFTTQHASRALVAARGELDDEAVVPAPVLAFPDPAVVFDDAAALDALLGVATRDAMGDELWGWSNPTGVAHDHVGVIASGVVTVARFTREETGELGPEEGTFDVDQATGAPHVVEAARAIPVTFVLPAAPPATPAGYPVAVFGHGLGASRHAILTFAEPLTRAGFAVVAIDFNDFGSRYRADDLENNTDQVIESFSGDPDLADGFGDAGGTASTFAFLRGFVNLSAVRDSVRQSVLDLSQLVRLLHDGDLDLAALAGAYGGLQPRLDTARIAYLGESYGALVGAVFAAVEPDVDLFVLDVPGGGILDLEIASSPEIGSMLIPFARSVYGVEGAFDRFHPVVSMAQSILDAADPLTYAPHVLADRFTVGDAVVGPRSVLAIEVVGDELIPNGATHALARAMGLPVLQPSLVPVPDTDNAASPAAANVDGQTAALVQYAPATHGSNWTSEVGMRSFYPGAPAPGSDPFPRLPAPIEISNPMHATLDQVVTLLLSHQLGAPIIESTLAPIADFDDDGTPDADEVAAGSDPYDPAR